MESDNKIECAEAKNGRMFASDGKICYNFKVCFYKLGVESPLFLNEKDRGRKEKEIGKETRP